MNIKESITLQKAIDVFKIPFSEIDKNGVKSIYRDLCKKNHPDSGNGEILDMDFLKQCRDVLIEQCNFIGEKDFKERVRKTTAKDVFMTNKVLCDECEGYGDVELITNHRTGLSFCRDCGGSARIVLPVIKCKFCKSGQFRLKDGHLIKCRACKGTGIFKHSKTVRCKTCSGNGYYFNEVQTNKTYHHCRKCSGFGFIEIDNPIFKAGTIF